jgi:hypothetical protein
MTTSLKGYKGKILKINGCGDLIETVKSTVNYECSGDDVVLVHTEDLKNTNDTTDTVSILSDFLEKEFPKHEGYVLLRR